MINIHSEAERVESRFSFRKKTVIINAYVDILEHTAFPQIKVHANAVMSHPIVRQRWAANIDVLFRIVGWIGRYRCDMLSFRFTESQYISFLFWRL
jgi:hypothetical protein